MPSAAEKAADRLQVDGINALAIPCDVADAEQVAQLFERAVAQFWAGGHSDQQRCHPKD